MLKKCKYLLLLFVGLFCFTCFGYCTDETVEDLIVNVGSDSNATINSNGNINIYYAGVSDELGTYCVRINSYDFTENVPLQVGYSKNGSTFDNGTQYLSVYSFDTPNLTCFYIWYGYIMIKNPNSYQITNLNYEVFKLDDLLTENLPKLTSAQCQSEYGLIPESSVDQNYCIENELCPISTGSRSELVINDVVHEGRPLININIPDYIQWDYAVDENQYDIYVGSGYDQDYIDSVLKINSYRPDNKDFTQIFVSGLTLIFPYIFVALLIVFIWKLLKRIFR